MKNICFKKLIIFASLFLLICLYSYFFLPISEDEVWNYGFSYNIASGLVPYRDFNMLQTPFSFFLNSILVIIFGNHVYTSVILSSFFITLSFYFMYKEIGIKSIIILPLLLLYTFYSYNLLCLFFAILILGLINNDYKYKDILIGFIVGLMFITKQNIGICFVVPMLFYSKNKLKSIYCFMIPLLLLSIYLVYNNAFYDFINYCFLALFEFGGNNGVFYYVGVVLFLCLFLGICLIKSRFRNELVFYVLTFQVIAFPLFDLYHFLYGFIIFLYYILLVRDFKRFKIKYYFTMSFAIFLIIMFVFSDMFNLKFEFYGDKDSFMYMRRVNPGIYDYFMEIENYIDDNIDEYNDNIFIFSGYSYLIKLDMNIPINEYDLILNGNMGFNGSEKIINSVNERCSNEDCLFIVNKDTFQLNKDILNFVKNRYTKIDNVVGFKIYSNKE